MPSRESPKWAWALLSVGLVLAPAACGLFDDPLETTIVWQSPIPTLGPGTHAGDAVFFATRAHELVALEKSTGAVRWLRSSNVTGSNLVTQESPVIAGDLVVLGDEYLHAFDRVTGAPRWKFGDALPASTARPGVYDFASDGSVVYAGSVIGSAFAIDAATGTQVWRTDLIPGADNQMRIITVSSGLVFLRARFSGPEYSGRVYALEATSGAVVWSFEPPPQPGMRTGTVDGLHVVTPSGPRLVVSFDDGRIVSLTAIDGQVNWTIPRRSVLIVQNDTRRLTASGSMLIATATAPDELVAYDIETGESLWTTPSDQGSVLAPIMSHGGTVYANYIGGSLAAYDAATGQRRWLRNPPAGAFFGAPVVSGDTLFVAGTQGTFALVK